MPVEHQDARAHVPPAMQRQLRALVVRERDPVAW
jgi:hypothetical protein